VSIAGDLWTIDLLAGRAVQITTEEFTGNPVWSRDGKKLFYTTGTRPSLDRRAIAWVSADRSTQPVTLTSDDGVYVTSDVAQGGAILARRENPKNPGAGGQYLSFPISPDGTRLGEGKPFLASRSRLQNLRISPSGEFVAYQALESGRTEVEVAPYPGPGGIVRISTDEGGAAPQWSEDGRQLFYVSNGNKLMVVDVLKSSLEFVASAPKMVLENFRPPYAVARGRFLKFQLPGANQPDELHIVTNWVDTLRRLAPAK
jgi:Tol biopolymer transport system component